MKYDDYRHNIKSGDVISYTHSSLRNWNDFLIFLDRLFTRSDYCHTAIAWKFAGRIFLLEAVASGVRIYPLRNKLPCYHLTREGGLPDDRLEFALSKMGEEYSDWECIKSFFGRNDPGNKFWQCSEFVQTVLQLPCAPTPTAIVKYLLGEGSVMREVKL